MVLRQHGVLVEGQHQFAVVGGDRNGRNGRNGRNNHATRKVEAMIATNEHRLLNAGKERMDTVGMLYG